MAKARTLNEGFSSLVRGWGKKSDMEIACLPKKVMHVLLLMLWLACGASVRAGDGYEAVGYFTYTRFNALGNPTHKKVMMFDVKVDATKWHIRTEPVIEGNGGIGFYEASHTTNDLVLMVTALESAYNNSESPFHNLRAGLKQSKKDDVFFTNPAPAARIPAAFSNSVSSTDRSRQTPDNASNVAVAVALKGNYPRVDQSYVAFLWFAFTPPTEENDGANRMLLQIWDDGNPQSTRFRRAKWNQFTDSPYLVSSAVYDWVGKELFPNGSLENIDTSDVSNPIEIAVRYDVEATTSVGSFTLPLNFKLTRFTPQRSKNEGQKVSSTIVASVTRAIPFSSTESMDVKIPGKTFVSDYRLSTGELKGTPLRYFLASNSPPAVEQVKQSGLYERTLGIAKGSAPKPNVRWVLLAFLLVPSLAAIILWKYVTRPRELNKNFLRGKPKTKVNIQ